MTLPLLLDTDVGSDVDDELALALIWGSPELDLRGVCTTYGDVALRAAIVLEMAGHLGRRVAVAAGASGTRSGREVWWAGHEGRVYGDLSHHRVEAPAADALSPGARLLASDDDAHVLAIGPLGSLADALDAGARPAGITLMGGEWTDPSTAEHNLASDAASADRVLTSGLPVTAVGIDLTRQVRFGEDEITRFAACGHLGAILAVEMHAWMRRTGEEVEVPHDPLTALTLVEPELFELAEPCAVAVSDGSAESFGPEGAVRRLDRPGAVRVATAVDVEAARRALADRIARGLGERARS